MALLASDATRGPMTASGVVMGTVGYMSPEVEIAGGVPVALADVGISTGGAWNHDGVILFGSLGGAGLSAVPAAPSPR